MATTAKELVEAIDLLGDCAEYAFLENGSHNDELGWRIRCERHGTFASYDTIYGACLELAKCCASVKVGRHNG